MSNRREINPLSLLQSVPFEEARGSLDALIESTSRSYGTAPVPLWYYISTPMVPLLASLTL
jgi:hypothetical protein